MVPECRSSPAAPDPKFAVTKVKEVKEVKEIKKVKEIKEIKEELAGCRKAGTGKGWNNLIQSY